MIVADLVSEGSLGPNHSMQRVARFPFTVSSSGEEVPEPTSVMTLS
jgi:hypothetical protein